MGPTGTPLELPLPEQVGVKTLPDGRPAPVDPDAAKRGEKEDFGPDANAILAFAAALIKPFELVGKVVDQNGAPVAGATIHWSANNNPNPNKSGTKGQTTSNSHGMFSVKSHGLDVYVRASKEGYGTLYSNNREKIRGSDGAYMNGGFLGNTDLPMGTKAAPAILVLRKMGETVPLVKAENFIPVPRDGSRVRVNLEDAQLSSNGGLNVEAWTNDQLKNEEGHYDWRCRLSVPNGGLLVRTDQSVFEAPIAGYVPSDEINMPQAAERWSPQVSREYFVKLSDGRYARIQFEMVAGGDNFISLISFLNPTPGDRNLEFDPAKAVTVP